MIFTLYSFYRRAAMSFDYNAQAMREQGAHQASEVEQAQRAAGLARFLGRRRLAELTDQVGRTLAEAEVWDQLAGECHNRTRVLEQELLDVELFIDGVLSEAR
jgi:hypothetical protein